MVVASFHLVRYPGALSPTARVPIDRRSLARAEGLAFGRLLGTGAGRRMAASADLTRWATFAIWSDQAAAERFLATHPLPGRWAGALERFDVLLAPVGAHGAWGGRDPLAGVELAGPTVGAPIAVVTRATVRWRRVRTFLRAVPPVDAHLDHEEGLLATVGIGEAPIGRQATFSLWRSASDVARFAHRSEEHAEVVRRTRDEDWYGEEWFARFRPLRWSGTWAGGSPLGDDPAGDWASDWTRDRR